MAHALRPSPPVRAGALRFHGDQSHLPEGVVVLRSRLSHPAPRLRYHRLRGRPIFIYRIRRKTVESMKITDGSSDIATHLRTVHFTLTVSCAVLFISTKLFSETPATLAFEQFQHISVIVSQWTGLWHKFAAEQISWMRNNNAPHWKEPSPSHVFIRFDDADRSRFAAGKFYWEFDDIPQIQMIESSVKPDGTPQDILIASGTEFENMAVPVKPPTSIADFERFWDHSGVRVRVVRLSPDASIQSRNGNVQRKRWQPNRPTDILTGMGFRLSLRRSEDCPIKQPKDWAFCSLQSEDPRREMQVAIPADIDDYGVPILPSVWFAKEVGLSLPGTAFAQAFPELHQITVDYADLPLTKSESILRGERQRSEERVELVGLRIPFAALTMWGPLVILLVQVYLCLHLNALRSASTNRSTPSNVAWIGLYTDVFSRILCIVTLVLPAFVLFIITAHIAYTIVAFVLTATSVALLALIWRAQVLPQLAPAESNE